MAERKQLKVAKQTTKMFKSMVSAIPGVGAIAGLLTEIVSASGVLAPIEAVISVIMGLFGVMGAQIIPVLMDAIMPLIELLLEMTPIFVLIGQVIGILIQIALIPMGLIIQLLTALIIPFLPLFAALIPIFQAISPLISTVAELFAAFLPILFPLIIVLQALNPLIKLLADFLTQLVKPIESITKAGAGVVKDVGKGIGGFFKSIGFQQGTDFVPRTMDATVHRGEEIIPASSRGVLEGLVEELIEETRMTREDKAFRNSFRR